MITIKMTVAEMIETISIMGYHTDLGRRLTEAIAAACEPRKTVTLCSLPADKMVAAIKSLRACTGWGLKESKEWCEVVRGYPREASYAPSGYRYIDGRPHSLALDSDMAARLVADWRADGLEVTVQTYKA